MIKGLHSTPTKDGPGSKTKKDSGQKVSDNMNLQGSFTAEAVSFSGKFFCIRKDCFAPLANSPLI
jgi:hypothetical protein